MSDAIVLVPYDPAWPLAFDKARAEIEATLPLAIPLIAHIGSTAVPGLTAKPVIDIIVQVEALAPVREHLPALAALRYEFRAGASTDTSLFLRRRNAAGERSHHLHIHASADEVQRHIIFRDMLRARPALQRDYVALKQRLARDHADDRAAYASGKDSFIDAVVLAAGGPRRP